MNYMYTSTFARKNNNRESRGESEVSNTKKTINRVQEPVFLVDLN